MFITALNLSLLLSNLRFKSISFAKIIISVTHSVEFHILHFLIEDRRPTNTRNTLFTAFVYTVTLSLTR